MSKGFLLLLTTVMMSTDIISQEFVQLWPAGKMPNSKGMHLTDSISNERIHRVGTPGMYAYFPSAQENKRAAVVICPGGGYERLAYQISGIQLAKWFNTIGMAAFVLNYRLPTSPDLKERDKGPLQDAQRAIRIIRSRADEWGIDPRKIGIQGSSAGGHLAAIASTSLTDLALINETGDTVSCRPDFTLLISPVIDMGKYTHSGSRKNLLGTDTTASQIKKYSAQLQVTAATPPAFIVHSANDQSVDPHNSLFYYQSLLEKKVISSLHIFPQGGHAIALRNNPGSANQWTQLCESWLQEMNFLLPINK